MQQSVVVHKANTRGNANHGWLNSFHTFSFDTYYDRSRMGFGKLRVINDDHVKGGKGFGTHPHNNMEIVSIPLDGELAHQDSMGNKFVLKPGMIQVMSAGTGVLHSEFNNSPTNMLNFLQIWVEPDTADVEPRYLDFTIDPAQMKNTLCQILSPDPSDGGAWVHSKSWFNLGQFDANAQFTYTVHNQNSGVYAFIIEGSATINEVKLDRRDGAGFSQVSQLQIQANCDLYILLMEIPMK